MSGKRVPLNVVWDDKTVWLLHLVGTCTLELTEILADGKASRSRSFGEYDPDVGSFGSLAVANGGLILRKNHSFSIVKM